MPTTPAEVMEKFGDEDELYELGTVSSHPTGLQGKQEIHGFCPCFYCEDSQVSLQIRGSVFV